MTVRHSPIRHLDSVVLVIRVIRVLTASFPHRAFLKSRIGTQRVSTPKLLYGERFLRLLNEFLKARIVA